MNIGTYSPALTLVFAWGLIWILMGLEWKKLSGTQKYVFIGSLLLLALLNQGLRMQLGNALYSKLIALTMHVPAFLMFRWLTGRSTIKVIFVILSVIVFTAPIVLVGRAMEFYFEADSITMFLANLLVMAVMVLVSGVLFRHGFLYLLKWGSDRVFCLYSLVPLLYYVYIFVGQNVDLSAHHDVNGIILRAFPTIYVYAFYLLLMYNFREFRRKEELEITKLALQHGLTAAEEQIRQINEHRMQMAIYRHDMRHHLTMISNLLKTRKLEQAELYIKEVQENIEELQMKNYCENEIVNLLCSSFVSRARKTDVNLSVDVQIPQKTSVSDVELCALISNGMENALHTVEVQKEDSKWVEFSCHVNNDKLLLQIRNSCYGSVVMENGRPVSYEDGHGYGCHSIQAIADRYKGQCRFEKKDDTFVLRVILPLEKQMK